MLFLVVVNIRGKKIQYVVNNERKYGVLMLHLVRVNWKFLEPYQKFFKEIVMCEIQWINMKDTVG